MNRFLTLLAIALTCLSLFTTTAEAKRFGGAAVLASNGRCSTTDAASARNHTVTAPAPAGNRWLGPLAGLAIGAGLGALFAGGGLGGAMGNVLLALLAAGVVMFLISKFRKPQPMQYAAAGAPYNEPGNRALHHHWQRRRCNTLVA